MRLDDGLTSSQINGERAARGNERGQPVFRRRQRTTRQSGSGFVLAGTRIRGRESDE
jgi:hypothetical protein